MTVQLASESLTATRTALTLTDAEFEQEYSSVRVAIETAVSAGYYSTSVVLDLLGTNKVELYLTAKGYTVMTNRDGAAVDENRSVTITWLPKL